MSFQGGSEGSPNLTWLNVGIGLLFIVFDAVLSGVLGLGIGTSLIVAALRCIVQLTVMSLVLGKVFDSDNIWAVAGIALLLNVLGAIEATFNKAKRRYTNMVRTGFRFSWSRKSERSLTCPVSHYPVVHDVRHDPHLDPGIQVCHGTASFLAAGSVR